MTIKALTIHQLWAWAILAGHKTIENRTWSTNYRGPLAIHAGASRASCDESAAFIRQLGIEPPPVSELTFGAVIGVCDVVDVISMADKGRLIGRSPLLTSPWFEGPFGFVLANVRPLLLPLRGMPGLFSIDLPDDLIAR